MISTDHSHNPTLSSWVDGADAHPDFPIQNLPLGVFSPPGETPRIGTAIGEFILDLSALARGEMFPERVASALQSDTLNALFALTGSDRLALRHRVSSLLSDPVHRELCAPHLHRASGCIMHLPARIGDYTDFYVGIHHATTIGALFRPDAPLLPNYKHVPIGYHGRASSVRVSGHDVVRPHGQRKLPDQDAPDFGPSRRLDYELELGVWIAGENDLGSPVPIADAPDRIAGFCLLNDWSARDLQAWEYQPLGPFLAKNFLTSISPWVITAEAMDPLRIPQPARPVDDPAPLPYLWDEADQKSGALALDLAVHVSTTAMRAQGLAPALLSQSAARHMYWTVAQMVTHHAAGGCNLMPGDLLGTGTISGPTTDSYGSLMETTRSGAAPLTLPGGETRSFLLDGDEVILSARAVAEGHRSIGFGACSGTVRDAV